MKPAHPARQYTAADIARALGGRRSGAGWLCRCPAHDDHDPSLRITERDGKVLVKCWSGCEQGEVIDALRRRGLWAGKASPASWGRKTSPDSTAESDQASRPDEALAQAATLRAAVSRIAISGTAASSSRRARLRTCASRRTYGIGPRNRAGRRDGARLARQRR